MKRLLIALGCLTVPVSLFPLPGLSAQKRAITIDDYLVLKSVGNPQLSPDGKWVAYTVTEQSLKDNRGITRIWLADVASGAVRQLTTGPGSDRQPRWSPDGRDRKSTRLNSSHVRISYAVFCLKKKNKLGAGVDKRVSREDVVPWHALSHECLYRVSRTLQNQVDELLTVDSHFQRSAV